MECNKDEAIRAAEIAEKKYAMQDLVGAKKFVLKAMQLFPGLERAKQMLAVVEVHAAAQQKLHGIDDWYGILQVDPFADDATIKKQYRKLALMLHPDKNKLVGAEPAFKLIQEAWVILSDKAKRTVYDVKRSSSSRIFMRKPPPQPGVNGCHTAPPPPPPAPPAAHAAPPVRSSSAGAPAPAPTTVPPPSAPPPPPQAAAAAHSQETFWTQCPSCKIQYQYYRKYENYQLLCHRCKTGFLAKDIGVPPMETASWPRGRKNKKQSPDGVANGVNGFTNGVNQSHEGCTSNAFQQMQQRAREREEKRREEERRKLEREREREQKRKFKEALKKAKEEDRRREALERQTMKQREREEKEARKKMMEALKKKFKKNKMDEDDEDDEDGDEEDVEEMKLGLDEDGSPRETFRLGLRRSHRARKTVRYRDDFDDEDGEGPASKRAKIDTEMDKLTPEDIVLRQELAEKGRQHVLKALGVILKKYLPEESKVENDVSNMKKSQDDNLRIDKEEKNILQENGSGIADISIQVSSKSEDKVAEEPFSSQVAEKSGEVEIAKVAQDQPVSAEEQECVQNRTELPSSDSDDSDEELHYDVPDPDFHDFDTDRRQEDVHEGQVWALYDDSDGMPRFYCEIKEVVSTDPFKVRIRWLEAHQLSEIQDDWMEAGFTLTCGQFKCKRKIETEEQINKFSHLMQIDRIQAKVFNVFPKRGEVWALYKDWTLKWLHINHEGKTFKYDMVEVISDFSEETGVTVTILVKVEGFKTIFARGTENATTFNRRELLRFSHRVPAHWMTGAEKPNAPKDCWELDTAATPADLIYGER